MICDIYDNVLEEHVAQLIDMEMKEISWKYDYRSHKDGVNKHWHTLCGHEELFEEYSFLAPIWETAKRKYPKCVPRATARKMSKSQITSAVKRKRAKAQGVGGKPTNVRTFKKKNKNGKKIKKSN